MMLSILYIIKLAVDDALACMAVGSFVFVAACFWACGAIA